jgi:hypothetical protein
MKPVDAKFKAQEIKTPLQQFEKKYTYINEDTLKSGVSECPELVKKMFYDETLDGFARSHVLFAIAGWTEDKDSIFTMMMEQINHSNEFIREIAVRGLYQCYASDIEKYGYLKDVLEKRLEQEKAEGVRKRISSVLAQMSYSD